MVEIGQMASRSKRRRLPGGSKGGCALTTQRWGNGDSSGAMGRMPKGRSDGAMTTESREEFDAQDRGQQEFDGAGIATAGRAAYGTPDI
jgi:hypothetical protein